MQFDIVISSCKKDQIVLQKAIESIKEYVEGYRRIIVVSNEKLTNIEGVEWFDEKKYPFSIKDIYENMHNMVPEDMRKRKVSYINQLIKLYAHRVIPGLLENILIYDSDIIFIRKTTFFEDGKPLYGSRVLNYDMCGQYLNHFKKLHSSFDFHKLETNQQLLKQGLYRSGICHHIVYNRDIIEEIIALIEKTHGETFWKFYLNQVDTRGNNPALWCEPANCGLYYNYVSTYHPDKITQRCITWMECPAQSRTQNSIVHNYDTEFENKKALALSKGHSYIAFHSYNREYYSLPSS